MSPTISLATKHGKLSQIAPWIEALDCWTVQLAEIDTDQFGTFSGEVAREKSPRDTAIAKARAAADLLGCDYGLASEGTIGAHPAYPWINSDHEILALVRRTDDFVLTETFLSPDIQAHSEVVDENTNLDELVAKLDLPTHAAIIVAGGDVDNVLHKGVQDPSDLKQKIMEALSSGKKLLRVENDFRAMHSPSRQANIIKCAELLAKRIETQCAACGEIGFGKVGYEYGLPCSDCDQVVQSVANSERHACVSCEHTELRTLGKTTVDPSRCDFCNP
jgi:hypothetical protein